MIIFMSETAQKLYSSDDAETISAGTLLIKKCFFNLKDLLKKI